MKILETQAQNFLSYDKLFFTFKNGLYLIYGENGTGKSSISEAVYWCLFGILLREGKIDDVVNNKKLKNCYVKIFLEKGYTVTRYRKHKKFKNELFLEKDGVDIRKENIKETQKEIERLLGVNALVFSIVNLFSVDTIRFISASDGDKKKILDTMFPNMDYIRPKIIDKQSEIKDKTSNFLNSRKKLYMRVDIMLDDKSNLTKPSAKDITYIKKQKEKFSLYKKYIDKNKEINKVSITSLKSQNNIRRSILDLTNEIEDITDAISINESKLELLKDEFCPTCGTVIKSNKLKKLVKEYQQESKKLFTSRNIKKKKLISNKKLFASDDVIKRMEKSIEKYDSYRDKTERYYKYKYKLDSLLDDKKEYDAKYKEYEQNIRKSNFEIKLIEKELVKLNKVEKHYSFLSKALLNQGVNPIPIRSFLYELVLPILEKEARKILLKFDSNMRIKLAMENRERIIVNVSKYDGAGKFKLASGGEKRRADLAISLAIRKLLLRESNILFLDDVFDVVDDDGIENILSVLNSFIDTTAIYCISPKENETAYFENVIKIEKINGFSKLKGKI